MSPDGTHQQPPPYTAVDLAQFLESARADTVLRVQTVSGEELHVREVWYSTEENRVYIELTE